MIENAKITGTSLGYEDHGIFTACVMVKGDGWGCGFGGYSLDTFDKPRDRRIGTVWGFEFIRKVLETVGVEAWENLPGHVVRCEIESAGMGRIVRLGHTTEDKWFDPKADLKEYEVK